MEEQKAAAPAASTTSAQPVPASGSKEFPTSFVPQKAVLTLPRSPEAELKHWHIEAIHIVIFVLLLVVLYLKTWTGTKS
jgi:hypothetical protein